MSLDWCNYKWYRCLDCGNLINPRKRKNPRRKRQCNSCYSRNIEGISIRRMEEILQKATPTPKGGIRRLKEPPQEPAPSREYKPKLEVEPPGEPEIEIPGELKDCFGKKWNKTTKCAPYNASINDYDYCFLFQECGKLNI